MTSPVILHWPGDGPIIAEVNQEIGDAERLLSIRFGNVLVLVLPADAEDQLVDAIVDAQAARLAPVTLPRQRQRS